MKEEYTEIIEDAARYIENFDKPARKLIAQLRIGNLSGLSEVVNAVEGAQWLLKVCMSLKQEGLVRFEAHDQITRNLANSVSEIEEAFSRNDITLLADVLEYEISDMVLKMSDILKEVK